MSDEFRRDFWIGIGVIFISFVAFASAAYWLTQDIQVQAFQVAGFRRSIEERNRSIGTFAQLKAITPTIQLYQAKMDLLLPPQDGVIDFPRWMETLARTNNVASSFSFLGSPSIPNEAGAGFMSFSLDVTGAYDNVRNFFKGIEVKSGRFLIILDSFDLSYRDESTYRVTSQGRVFFR